MNRSSQKGVALLFTLILVLVLSVMTASMMFLAQSETWSSLNYRLMTQTRYGAEAGLNAAANYFANTYPGVSSSTGFTMTGSPVTYSGSPVVLSSLSGVSSNYPTSSVATAFASASAGSLTGGPNTVNYTASAKLISMKNVSGCGTSLYTQLWKITAHGDVVGAPGAEEEVSALLESHVVPCFQYAAFATSTGCGAINWSGGGPIDSYSSGAVTVGTAPATQAYDGNVGSNGNLNLAPHTSITGNFSGPETGVGACSSGDAISGATPSTISQYISDCQVSATSCGTTYENQLAQTVIYPPPNTAYPGTTSEPGLGSATGVLNPTGGCVPAIAGTGCFGDISGNVTLSPYVDASHVCRTATYYVNTISMTGQKSLTLAPCPVGSTPAGAYVPILLNVVDVNNSGSPISIGGGSIGNPSYNPMDLQIYYAGTGSISVSGGSAAAGVLYAPKASVTMNGANSAWYGSLIASTLTLNGNGASIHYDRQLMTEIFTVGNWTMDTFTWSKY
jgi:Tfp pilus assembly protein PilX